MFSPLWHCFGFVATNVNGSMNISGDWSRNLGYEYFNNDGMSLSIWQTGMLLMSFWKASFKRIVLKIQINENQEFRTIHHIKDSEQVFNWCELWDIPLRCLKFFGQGMTNFDTQEKRHDRYTSVLKVSIMKSCWVFQDIMKITQYTFNWCVINNSWSIRVP